MCTVKIRKKLLAFMKPCLFGFVALVILTQRCYSVRTLCDSGWTRCVNKCHKLIEHDTITTYQEAVDLCAKEGLNVTLAILMTLAQKNCFAKYIQGLGMSSALIVLHDQDYEAIFQWDLENDLIIEEWPFEEAARINATLFDPNSTEKNCVEVTDSGEWVLIACENPSGWNRTVCQKHIPVGTICGLNGEKMVH